MPSKFVYSLPKLESKADGQSLHLFFDAAEGAADKGLALVGALNEAKAYLDIAVVVLERKERKQLIQFVLQTFFCADPKFHDFLCGFVAGKLKIIRGGLSQDTLIKIGDLRHKETGKQVGGFVSQSHKAATKYYHTSVGEGENAVRYGAIHIANHSITSNALIHEASHKFIQTEDYFYFKPGGKGATDFELDPQEGYDPKDDTQPAFNADSYAWLAWFIGVVVLRKN